jgi:8-oxo-dGTP pyrophosphatase MutT (NUDIX family)
MLFGRRRDNGLWTEPGGHAEPGEDPRSCAIRELFEETGLVPETLELMGEARLGTKGLVRVSVFRATVFGEPTGRHDPDWEMGEFRWVDLSQGLPDDMKGQLNHDYDLALHLLGVQGFAQLAAETDAKPA